MQRVNADIIWPRKAVVTAGMPYGNKSLHFGHIGGVFVPADAFARFLRDRIGAENVRFVCGTDCYGSPIDEGYRKAVESGFDGMIADYVKLNHDSQAQTLSDFNISLDIFEGSGIGHAAEVHQSLTHALLEGLFEQGHLSLESTLQFYDPVAGVFLNGRQVRGKCCPVQGCKAANAYADECDLGHQYSPVDLMDPISTVSGTRPEMRPVNNWYFDLPGFKGFLEGYVEQLAADDEVRPMVVQAIAEFLAPPVIFVKNDFFEDYLDLKDDLPPHEYREAEKGKASFELEFSSISDRDEARNAFEQRRMRFRTSKTLVPFRITGNIEWGVSAPVLKGVDGLTVWCWPESLWAPISFTIAANDRLGLPREAWREFWCGDSSQVYQFIGEDNIYFYGVAQPAIFEALGSRGVFGGDDAKPLKQTTLVANHHLLFGKTKASSSGDSRPPTGEQLLEHYTVEELRAHFLALGLDQKAVKFSPKPFDPALTDEEREDSRRADPALKEGALLTNVFNRLARSCFYEAERNFDGYMPVCAVSEDVQRQAKEAMADYEACMHKVDLHSALSVAEGLIRYSNKHWSAGISEVEEAAKSNGDAGSAEDGVSAEMRSQLLADCFYLLRICTLLMHPIAPKGCETICSYMDFSEEEFFSWNYDFDDNRELCSAVEIDDGRHTVRQLPSRFDFFPKHPSRFK